jgi:Tfp pilus assembly protein FimT
MIKASRRSVITAILAIFANPRLACAEHPGHKATIAQERFAKMIAFAHQRAVADKNYSRKHSGKSSVAIERYVASHWHEYIEAAQAMLDVRG